MNPGSRCEASKGGTNVEGHIDEEGKEKAEKERLVDALESFRSRFRRLALHALRVSVLLGLQHLGLDVEVSALFRVHRFGAHGAHLCSRHTVTLAFDHC
jgi:hypothetical protein